MMRNNAMMPMAKGDGTEMSLKYIKVSNDDILELLKLYNIISTGLLVYVDDIPVEIYKEKTEGRPLFHKYYIFVKCTADSNGQTIRECSDSCDSDRSIYSCEQRNVGQTILRIMRNNPKYGIEHFTVF
jgi:hypothetical protein